VSGRELLLQTILAVSAVACFTIAYLLHRVGRSNGSDRVYAARLRERHERITEDFYWDAYRVSEVTNSMLITVARALEEARARNVTNPDELEDRIASLFVHMN